MPHTLVDELGDTGIVQPPPRRVTIRRAVPGDAPDVLRLAMDFAGAGVYPVQGLACNRELVAIVVEFVLEQGACWLGMAGDDAVALLGVVPCTHPFTGERFVDEIAWWVDPAWRRGQVGPHLVEAMLEWAAAEGFAFVKMVRPASQGRALAEYYRGLGFVELETTYLKRLAA